MVVFLSVWDINKKPAPEIGDRLIVYVRAVLFSIAGDAGYNFTGFFLILYGITVHGLL